MGTTFHLQCPYCKKEFDWNEGPGMATDVLHCDKCGKELWTQEELAEMKGYRCSCGGYFDKDVPIICPSCGKEVPNPRKHILSVTMWD